jgi:hypothetical protein
MIVMLNIIYSSILNDKSFKNITYQNIFNLKIRYKHI